jgi:hypothetical protein
VIHLQAKRTPRALRPTRDLQQLTSIHIGAAEAGKLVAYNVSLPGV